MWTDAALNIVEDNAPYTGLDGTRYPWNFPKAQIPNLVPVTVVQPPLGPYERYGTPTLQPATSEYVYPAVPFAPAEITALLTDAVQRHLDDTARTHGYDGILSACTYATDTHPPFQAEGQACVAWRGAVWAACYALMAEVQAGTRVVPTEAELIALLPVMVWP